VTSEDNLPYHPAVQGREAEMAALAASVRRLIDATVSNLAPPAVVAEAAAGIDRIVTDLAAHVPEGPISHTMGARGGGGLDVEGMATRMPFDVVVGPYSPLALPIELSVEDGRAVGRGRFTLPYEGPPGCVHGAVIASTFDIVFTAANVLAGAGGPTVSLTLRYRRPTLLHAEAAFEAHVERTDGRRTFTTGRLVQNGVVTVEADGVFAVLDHDATRALGRRAAARSDDDR
jgi:acyl-coenzyme A thioesterase PaaI-like protein